MCVLGPNDDDTVSDVMTPNWSQNVWLICRYDRGDRLEAQKWSGHSRSITNRSRQNILELESRPGIAPEYADNRGMTSLKPIHDHVSRCQVT